MSSDEELSTFKRYLRSAGLFYKTYRQLIYVIGLPLILSLVPILWEGPIGLCAFILVLMSAYWIVICVPIAVTSLLPVILFPLFGIMTSAYTSALYYNDNIMFILGSLMIGIGVETSNLHQKLALRVVIFVGTHPRWLLLGVMSVSMFLSIWISNTAITAMMMPIILSLVKNLVKLDPDFQEKRQPPQVNIYSTGQSKVTLALSVEKEDEAENEDENGIEMNENEFQKEVTPEEMTDEEIIKSPKALNAIKCFLISIPYATLIGGSASLIGTNSNLVFKGYMEDNHPDDGMNFFTFMIFALPTSVVNLIIAWLVIGSLYLPKEKFFDFKAIFRRVILREKSNDHGKKIKYKKGEDPLAILIKRKYDDLGPYTWDQISVGAWFVIVILLLVTRDLYFIPGWGAIFKKGFVTDTTVAMVVLFILIVWPNKNIFKGGVEYKPLIAWNDIERMFPWSVIILLGGSLAMAKGCEISGLSDWMGSSLDSILPNEEHLILLITCLVCSLGTEFMSNVSMITIILPILDKIAYDKKISYFFILTPQTIAVNLSYMFPSAAAPNAIVFGVGYLKLKDMLLVGIIMKAIGLILILIICSLWLPVIFQTDFYKIYPTTTVVFNTTEAMALNLTTY